MKIAILTNFNDYNPGYSLTGIVKDQKVMLKKIGGHQVDVFVNTNFKGYEEVIKRVPQLNLTDYSTKKCMSKTLDKNSLKIKTFLENFIDNKYDIVITHDWIFTGWNLPYAMALQSLEFSKKTKYLHWIHSMPCENKDWWNIKFYAKNHLIVYPNKTDSVCVLENYKATPDRLEIIPHIKDLRTWGDFSSLTVDILDKYPEMMTNRFVKVYPVGTDRLYFKKVHIVISIMAALKRTGQSVCLCIANAQGSGRGIDERILPYLKLAREEGLTESEFFFTSETKGFESGVPKRELRELMQCSNLFIFPTHQETCGLVGLEEPLSGAKIMVLNRSLNMMTEVHRNIGLYFNFGSFDQDLKIEDQNKYCEAIARQILYRYNNDESVLASTWIRQAYNFNRIYNDYYLPIISKEIYNNE